MIEKELRYTTTDGESIVVNRLSHIVNIIVRQDNDNKASITFEDSEEFKQFVEELNTVAYEFKAAKKS